MFDRLFHTWPVFQQLINYIVSKHNAIIILVCRQMESMCFKVTNNSLNVIISLNLCSIDNWNSSGNIIYSANWTNTKDNLTYFDMEHNFIELLSKVKNWRAHEYVMELSENISNLEFFNIMKLGNLAFCLTLKLGWFVLKYSNEIF